MRETKSLASISLNPLQRRVFATTWITYALYYLGRLNLSPALPALALWLGVSRAEVGILGTIFFWVYAFGHFINGELGNHFSPHRIVAVGLLVIAVSNVLFSLQSSLFIMAIIWGINGFAQSTGWAPMLRILSEHVDPDLGKRLSPYMAMSYMVGTAFTWAVVGFLIARESWQAAFLLPGIALFGVLAFWWHSGIDAPPSTNRQEFRLSDIRQELAGLAPILVAVFFFGFVQIGTILWIPTYFIDTGLFAQEITGLMAATAPAVAIIGMLLASYLLERFDDVLLSVRLMLGAAILGLIITTFVPLKVQFISLIMTILLIRGSSGLIVTSVPMVMATQGRTSSVTGSINALLNFGGGLTGVAIGAMTERYGWNTVFWLWTGCLGVTYIMMWVAGRRGNSSRPDRTSPPGFVR